MNLLSLDYVNSLRKSQNPPELLLGSVDMFANAMKHSTVMDKLDSLIHQAIPEGIQELAGENVAYFKIPKVKNYALQCSMQWLHSEGHRRNMKDPSFKSMVTAIFVGEHEKVFCTQTFSRMEVPAGCPAYTE